MSDPLVSIIIPTYNRAHLIGETLDSILAQTYKNWECIIVDDHSTDQSHSIIGNYLKQDSRFQYYIRPKNLAKGPNACRNYGFSFATGSFVHFLDSDDLLTDNMLKTYMDAFEPITDAVVAPLQRFDETTDNIEVTSIISKHIISDYLVGKITYYVSGPFWRKSFLDKKELFDENIRNLDDWDFNLRMLYHDPILKYLDQPLVLYRTHNNSFKHELGKLNPIEIDSEFMARRKHLKILKLRDNERLYSILLNYTNERALLFMRIAVSTKNKQQLVRLFKIFVPHALEAKNYMKLLKTSFGTLTYLMFNKGYRLFV